jgi:hypothetical protein
MKAKIASDRITSPKFLVPQLVRPLVTNFQNDDDPRESNGHHDHDDRI